MKEKITISKYKNDHEVVMNDERSAQEKLVLINILDKYYIGGHMADPNNG